MKLTNRVELALAVQLAQACERRRLGEASKTLRLLSAGQDVALPRLLQIGLRDTPRLLTSATDPAIGLTAEAALDLIVAAVVAAIGADKKPAATQTFNRADPAATVPRQRWAPQSDAAGNPNLVRSRPPRSNAPAVPPPAPKPDIFYPMCGLFGRAPAPKDPSK